MKTIIEPFRIRTVEPMRITDRREREDALRRAHYNLFQLPAREVMIDLLTDSGTGAMSTQQWAALMTGDESYAGSSSFYELEAVVRHLTGYRHVFPVHQGRAAERILAQLLVQPGSRVPSNAHFDTTRANLEFAGAEAVDFPDPRARDLGSEERFKGNMDIGALSAFLTDAPPGSVPFGSLTITNNRMGGQPVSMENVAAVAKQYHAHGVPFLVDAARFAENAWHVQQFEHGYQGRDLEDIVREMFGHADGCWISAKKDGLVNIGGILAVDDDGLAARIRDLLILTEGFPTYGGLAGRDLAALAQGLREVLDHDYLAYRQASARYLASALTGLGVPVVRPPGLHAVYVDARGLLPRVPPGELPGQVICCELYVIGGIRAVEIGTLMFGATDLDLVRLCLPRRVYTQSHIDWVIESFAELVAGKDRLRGYRIVEEAPYLRAFTVKLAPLGRA